MRVEKDQINTMIAIAVLCIAYVLAIWMPQRGRIAEARERLDAAETALSSGQAGQISLQQMSADLRELRQSIQNSTKRIPDQSDLPALLRELSGEMEDLHVTDRTIQTQAMEKGDDYIIIPIRLTFRGSFASIYAFLQRLESMDRLVHVGKLELGGNSEGQDRTVSVRMDMAAFFLPEEATGS